jgi:hypothetical protein
LGQVKGNADTQSWISTLLTAIFGVVAIFATISSETALSLINKESIVTKKLSEDTKKLSEDTKISVSEISRLSEDTKRGVSEIRFLSEDTKKGVSEIHRLSKIIHIEVSKIKDKSYIPLTGFAEIFAKELWLVKQAESEIYYMSFFSALGYPHFHNEDFGNSYKNLEREDLVLENIPDTVEDACREFYDTLLEKIKSLQTIRIMVYKPNEDKDEDKSYKAFFDRLKNDRNYSGLFQQDSEVNKDFIIKKEQEFIDAVRTIRYEFIHKSNHERTSNRPLLALASKIPLHFLITKIGNNKLACVAYIVNEDRIGQLDDIKGHYTEDEKVINGYKEIIDVFMGSFNNE